MKTTAANAKYRETIIVLLGCVVLLAWAVSQGPRHRQRSDQPTIWVVDQPLQMLEVWQDAGVRGRPLMLVDRHNHTGTASEVPTDDTFLTIAIQRGVVRRVQHFVSVASWREEVSVRLASSDFSRCGQGYCKALLGLPWRVDSIEEFEVPGEPPLVLVDTTDFPAAELTPLFEGLIDDTFSDLVGVVGALPRDVAERLEPTYDLAPH